MTSMTPTFTVDEWLAATLTGDPDLATLAPGGVFGRGSTVQSIRRLQPVWPAVIFGYLPQGSRDNYDQQGIVFTQARYRIEAIDKSESVDRAKAAAARIHTLIQDAAGSDATGMILRCFRVQAIDRAETADGGAQFQHFGGIYEIWIRGHA